MSLTYVHTTGLAPVPGAASLVLDPGVCDPRLPADDPFRVWCTPDAAGDLLGDRFPLGF